MVLARDARAGPALARGEARTGDWKARVVEEDDDDCSEADSSLRRVELGLWVDDSDVDRGADVPIVVGSLGALGRRDRGTALVLAVGLVPNMAGSLAAEGARCRRGVTGR
jgi:hypothetical protein